jgi:hypothetical protein
MKINTQGLTVKETTLHGEFQLAELEQRLEMASASSMATEPIYYCCYCVAFCDGVRPIAM